MFVDPTINIMFNKDIVFLINFGHNKVQKLGVRKNKLVHRYLKFKVDAKHTENMQHGFFKTFRLLSLHHV